MFARLQNLTPREFIASSYVGAATAVVSGCALVALIKFRVIHKILPASLREKLDSVVNTIAERTEPTGIRKMAGMQSQVAYLQSVYGQATLGFVLGGLGTYLFVKVPHIPILPAIVGTGVSFGLLMFGPKTLLSQKQRHAVFASCCFLGGVSLGPMNWIAQQVNSLIFAAAISTTVAFTVTPLITRGWMANALLNQALSSSLALLAAKFIALRTFPALNGTFADPAVPVCPNKVLEFVTTPLQLDSLLLVQAVGNAVLVLLHSYPVLSGARDATQLDHVDAQQDALMVVGAVSFAVFKLFQSCVEFIARSVKGATTAKGKAAKVQAVAAAAGATAGEVRSSIDLLSGGVSTLVFLFLYVKFTERIQRSDDPKKSFRILTKLFSLMTPVKLAS